MKRLISILIVGTFVSTMSVPDVQAQTTSTAATSLSAAKRALLSRVQVLRNMISQIHANTTDINSIASRVAQNQRGVRLNTAALTKLSQAHRALSGKVGELEKAVQACATRYALQQLAYKVADAEGTLLRIDASLTSVKTELAQIRAGNFTQKMQDSVVALTNQVIASHQILEKIVSLENRVDILEEGQYELEKRFAIPGATARLVSYSWNREASTLGIVAGLNLDFPVGYGEICTTVGVGYGGQYGDLQTMMVDAGLGYCADWQIGLNAGVQVYYAFTPAFGEVDGDQTPTTSQFVGGRLFVGYDFLQYRPIVDSVRYESGSRTTRLGIRAGLLLGDDGHINIGHGFSVGGTFELIGRF